MDSEVSKPAGDKSHLKAPPPDPNKSLDDFLIFDDLSVEEEQVQSVYKKVFGMPQEIAELNVNIDVNAALSNYSKNMKDGVDFDEAAVVIEESSKILAQKIDKLSHCVENLRRLLSAESVMGA